MKKFFLAFKLFYETSNLMNFKNKKRRILFSIFLSNIIVGLDIIIILFFTSFLTNREFPFIQLIFESVYLLPILIIIRFAAVYFDAMNIQVLRLGIEENLRNVLIKEIFKSGNLSSSDSYFYLNILCPNVGSFYQYFTTLIASLVQLVLFTFYILVNNQNELIYIAIGGFLLFPIIKFLTRLGRQSSHISYLQSQEISDETEKIIENLFLIKILKKIDTELNKFYEVLNKYYKAQLNNQKYGTLNAIIPVSISTFILALSLLFFSLSFITLDFIAVVIRLFQSLGSFNKNLSWAATQFVYLENLKRSIENKKNIFDRNFSIDESMSNIIEISNVTFKYLTAEKNLFENLSIQIKENKKYLIVGSNGSGKSTLLGLMSGVYYPSFGNVKLKSKKTGYVSAYPMIIKDTLKNNLIYGNEELDIADQELIEWILKFELYKNFKIENLHARVSNKTLSSGQMQKIAFIRALLSKPKILFLDESTSNLDVFSKQVIKNVLSIGQYTIVNSTHNTEDFEDYDFILELSTTESGLTIVKENNLNKKN